MGNCLRTVKGSERDDVHPRIPKDDNLHLFPDRIINNDGRVASASIYTQQGRKGVNQDAMLLWDKFGLDEDGVLCGVFDGHGPQGHFVARRVRDYLPLKLLAALPKGRPELDLNVADWRRAFIKAYKCVDKNLKELSSLNSFCSGSTAVTVLKMGMNLYMGNIGDSRAVLGTRNADTGETTAVQLTVDLKPDLPREAARIKSCKGRVFALEDEPEVQRVWLPFEDTPGLAMARAFGDFCLKGYGVISVPEFFHFSLTENDQFVILASDGVWDVLSNKEVVDIISSCTTRRTAARKVVKAATRGWKYKFPTSRMDDCAVVVLFLDGNPNPDPEEPSENRESVSPGSSSNSENENFPEPEPVEPALTRNFTVRNAGLGEIGQAWAEMDGLTRANSYVQVPRYSGDRRPLIV